MQMILYKFDRSLEQERVYTDFQVNKFTPKLFKLCIPQEKKLSLKNRLVRLNFWAQTKGKAEIHYVLSDNDEIVHTSYVIPKCHKFGYLKKGDLSIGPCFTAVSHRGKGIYPTVLKKICDEYAKDGTDIYMVVAEHNKPSIRGIEKAGFVRCGFVDKSKLTKRYVVVEEA